MRALLDVNVLLALLDGFHLHHATATEWLRKNVGFGWASCPLTQNGCVRVMSQAKYSNREPAEIVAGRLGDATRDASHAFWADDISLTDRAIVDWSRVLSPGQITDVYLLALAVRHRGRFVTLDRGIDVATVRGAASRHLVVLASAVA